MNDLHNSIPARLPMTLWLLTAAVLMSLTGCGAGKQPTKDDAATARLLDDLAETAPETRMRAVEELGLRRETTATQPLIKCLADIRPDIRKAAVTALGRIGDRGAVPALSGIIDAKAADPQLRRLAARALADIADPSSVDTLSRSMYDADESLAFAAAHGLGSIGEPAVDVLVNAVKSDKPQARRAAASVLSMIASDRTRQAMRGLLTSTDPELRLSAAENLARAGYTNAAPEIVELLLDPSHTVRMAMPGIIQRLGLSAAGPLRKILALEGSRLEREDANGKKVRISIAPARHAAVKAVMGLEGPTTIAPLVTATAFARPPLADQVRARLMEQLKDTECRRELYRLASNGTVGDRALALAVVRSFTQKLIPATGRKKEREEAMDKAGIGDVRGLVPSCAHALKNGPPPLRFEAALLLCTLGDTRGRDLVQSKFWKTIRTIESLRAGAGKQKKPAGQATIPALRTEAATCLSALAPVADKALADKLVPLLASGDPKDQAWAKVRAQAVLVFEQVAHPDHIDHLVAAVRKDQRFGADSVRARACMALAAIGDKRAFDPIAKNIRPMPIDQYFFDNRMIGYRSLILCDPDRAYKFIGEEVIRTRPHRLPGQIDGIAALFHDFPDARAVPCLVHWINHDIGATKRKVRDLLVKLGRHNLSWLIEAFDTESHANRSSLAGLIANEFQAEALPAIRIAVRDKRPRIRQGAVWVLGCTGGRETIALVTTALGDPHHGVRSAAAWSAGQIKDTSFVDPLIGALNDKEPAVREMAAKQFELLHDARAVAPLIGLLTDKEPRVRAYAVLALAAHKAVEALPGVKALLKDENADVRKTAEYAVKMIPGDKG